MIGQRAQPRRRQPAHPPGEPHHKPGHSARVPRHEFLGHHDVDWQRGEETGPRDQQQRRRRDPARMQEQVDRRPGQRQPSDGDRASPQAVGNSTPYEPTRRPGQAEPQQRPAADYQCFPSPFYQQRNEGGEESCRRRAQHHDEVQYHEGREPPSARCPGRGAAGRLFPLGGPRRGSREIAHGQQTNRHRKPGAAHPQAIHN